MTEEEFKAKVLEALVTEFAPHKSKEFLRECVDDEYFRSEIESGMAKVKAGRPERGIRNAAWTISMCI